MLCTVWFLGWASRSDIWGAGPPYRSCGTVHIGTMNVWRTPSYGDHISQSRPPSGKLLLPLHFLDCSDKSFLGSGVCKLVVHSTVRCNLHSAHHCVQGQGRDTKVYDLTTSISTMASKNIYGDMWLLLRASVLLPYPLRGCPPYTCPLRAYVLKPTIRARGAFASLARGAIEYTTDGKSRKRALRPFRALQEALLRRIHAMFYGAMIWDPWLIVAQIACLQCLHYLSLGGFLWLFVGTHVPSFTLRFFFDYSVITTRTFAGWCTLLAYFVNALVGWAQISIWFVTVPVVPPSN